jgi:membrane protease YdiL (CAAX protease family)
VKSSFDVYSSKPARGWLPWGALAPVLALLFVIAGILCGTLLIAPFVRLDARQDPVDPIGLMAFTLVPFGLLLAVLLSWVTFIERRPLASIGLTGDRKFRTYLGGQVIGLASISGITLLIWIAGGLHATGFAPAWSSWQSLSWIALLLPCFALQAGVEELLFRGWLLSVVAKKFNVVLGVLLSSALFAFLHFSRGQHWLVTVSNSLFGIFACCWVLKSRNVLAVMGWHAGWNWLLAVGFNLPLTGLNVGIPALLVDLDPAGPAWLTGGAQGPEGSVFCVAFFLAAIIWLMRSIAARRK